jgi:hypothetical protein
MDKKKNQSKPNVVRTRHVVQHHFSAFANVLVIILFNAINDSSVVVV